MPGPQSQDENRHCRKSASHAPFLTSPPEETILKIVASRVEIVVAILTRNGQAFSLLSECEKKIRHRLLLGQFAQNSGGRDNTPLLRPLLRVASHRLGHVATSASLGLSASPQLLN